MSPCSLSSSVGPEVPRKFCWRTGQFFQSMVLSFNCSFHCWKKNYISLTKFPHTCLPQLVFKTGFRINKKQRVESLTNKHISVMSSVQPPRQLMLRFMIRVFPGLSRTTFPSSPEHPNVVAKSQTEYKDFEKSTLQERLRNQKEQSDRYLSNIFWTIFLIKGASGSRQTSLPFFKVALQRENEDAPMHVGLKTKAGAGVGGPFPLAKVRADSAAPQDLHHFHLGALRSRGHHLQITDHFGVNSLCGG